MIIVFLRCVEILFFKTDLKYLIVAGLRLVLWQSCVITEAAKDYFETKSQCPGLKLSSYREAMEGLEKVLKIDVT